MDREQYLDALTGDSERLADAATAAGTGAAVPTCPGWTVADLLGHVVAGDRWALTIVEQAEQGITERIDRGHAPEGLDGDALVQELRDGAERLVAALARVDPATSAWTFAASDRTVAFWTRRRSHETAVHRYDVETAAGTPSPIDAALATDGIDEFLGVFLPRLAEKPVDALADDAAIHLHCTDVDGEWLIARRGSDLIVTAEHAKGDVAARGRASDLLLFLWGRVPADTLEVFGDGELLARFGDAIKV
jgi:uncharacterized protein (TIGR03083 family)